MGGPDTGNAADGALLVGNVLAHHGTKGMRWGVRKKGAASHPEHPDHVTVKAHDQKVKEGGVKALSNHELQAIITRRNLEKQHRDLTGGGNKFDKGHKKIKKIISVAKTVTDLHNTIDTTRKTVRAVRTATGN